MKITAVMLCIGTVLLLYGCSQVNDQAERFVERGSHFRDAGQYDEALRLYQKAISVAPEHEEAYLEIALTYDEYLHDKEKAVSAYERYLDIAEDSVIKERAKEWLAAARADAGVEGTPGSLEPAAPTEESVGANEFTDRRTELQIKLLKDSLTDRYEREIEKIRQQLLDAQERIITLERENSVYQADQAYGDETLMLKQLSSNETLIARLQTELEQQRNQSDDAVKGQELLQSLVTNLQHELQVKTQKALLCSILNESNSLLTVYSRELESKLQLVENARDEMQLQLAEMAETGSVFNSSAHISFPALSNTIAELNRKIALHNQERDSFVQTVERMRSVVDNKNAQMKKLGDEIAGLKTQSVAQVDLQYYRGLVTSEKDKRVRSEKMLYDRTQQLRRLQQRYATLQQSYLEEAQRRQKVSAVLAQLQNEMNDNSRASIQPGRTAARSASTRTSSRAANTRPSTTRVATRTSVQGSSRKPARTYTVQKGDSLLKIARKMYGDQNKWTTIFEANRDLLDRPNQLRVGQVLRVP
jgi:nucleoid-associated protein YgaU